MKIQIICFVLFIVSFKAVLWGQKTDQTKRRNAVEFFFPVSHFFDGTKTNWAILIPSRRHVRQPDGSYVWKDIHEVPFTFGASYIRRISNRSSISVSAMEYFMRYFNDNRAPGEVMERGYMLFSLEYLGELLSRKRIQLQASGAIDYRYGAEIIHIHYPFPGEFRAEGIGLKDWGLSTGLRATYDLPWHFQLSAAARYTHFVYLAHRGLDFFGNHKDPTPNTLTFKIGLGYRF